MRREKSPKLKTKAIVRAIQNGGQVGKNVKFIVNVKIIAPFEFDGYPLHGSSVLSPLVPCVVVFMGKGGTKGGELRRIRTLFCNYHPVTLPSTYSRLRSEAFYSLLLPSVYPTRNFGLGPSIATSFRASWLLLTTYSPTNEPYSALAKSFNSEDTLCIAYFSLLSKTFR